MKRLDPAARPSTSEHDVHLTENVMVAMRDGVRMATDVYRPARGGRARFFLTDALGPMGGRYSEPASPA